MSSELPSKTLKSSAETLQELPERSSKSTRTSKPTKPGTLIIIRFSDGEAAYFYDVLSPLFEKKYAEEAAKNFKAFQTLNVYVTIFILGHRGH
jgi:hypothetical protein